VIGTFSGIPVGTRDAEIVPVPTWHAGSGVLDFRHAPPSIAALESSPAGRLSVMSFGVSPVDGPNFTSVVSDTLEAAVVELGATLTDGAIDAAAVAGAARHSAATRPISQRRGVSGNSAIGRERWHAPAVCESPP
jgi:hypothetical protein